MKHRTLLHGPRCALVALLAGSAASVCHATDPCEGPALNCNGVPFLQPGGTWIPAGAAWLPNRLPGVSFTLMNGNFCENNTESNYRGLNEWWCDPSDDPNCALELIGDPNNGVYVSGVQRLLSKMDLAYTQGFRRFMLYVPAGNVWGTKNGQQIVGQEYIASSQWWTMHPDKRELILSLLNDWKASPDRTGVQLEIYSSFPLASDPDDLCLGLPQGHS